MEHSSCDPEDSRTAKMKNENQKLNLNQHRQPRRQGRASFILHEHLHPKILICSTQKNKSRSYFQLQSAWFRQPLGICNSKTTGFVEVTIKAIKQKKICGFFQLSLFILIPSQTVSCFNKFTYQLNQADKTSHFHIQTFYRMFSTD